MSNAAYFNLAIAAPRRLAMMRADSAAPKTWREVRGFTLQNWQASFCTLDAGFNDGSPIWYSHNGPKFRNERDAHKVYAHLDHGYYTDEHCDETAVGIVASLTHGRFIAGYRWTSNDERVYFPQVFDDETDAARMADEHARVFAESARDDSERFNAMQDAEGLVESKESDLCEAWEQYRAAWSAFLADPKRHARAVIKAREWVSELIVDLRAFRQELADATRAYERGY